MKKHIALSAMVIGLLSSVSVQADDAVSTMFKDGKTSGQIREFSLNRAKVYSDSSNNYTERSNAIGGHLKYETAEAGGISLGARFDTTNGFANPDLSNTATDDVIHKPNLGADGEGYSILGEAYVQYKNGGSSLKIGRQALNSPLMAGDDYRMIRNFHNSIELANTSLKGWKFNLGHTTEMAKGTFGNTYAGGGILGATAGYNAVASSSNDFVNTGLFAVGEATAGVTTLGVTFTGVEGLKAQLWDYYAHDISNTIYGDISYKGKVGGGVSLFGAAQFIKQSDVGDKLLKNTSISADGDLEGLYYGVKAGLTVSGFTAYAAYSATSENDSNAVTNNDEAKNAIILQTGAYPIYTQGMVTRHMTFAGAKTMKFAAIYSFKAMGPDLKLVGYYLKSDLDKYNGYTYGDAKETGFDIIYNTAFAKNLQLRLRGNYADDFNVATNGDTVGWSEYRFIANYTF